MLTLPKSDVEKQVVLQKVIELFDATQEYHESEVDSIIKSCKVDDYVLFRRELVNFNYLGKDSYKNIYWVKKKNYPRKNLQK